MFYNTATMKNKYTYSLEGMEEEIAKIHPEWSEAEIKELIAISKMPDEKLTPDDLESGVDVFLTMPEDKIKRIKQSFDQLSAHYGESKKPSPEEVSKQRMAMELTLMSHEEVSRLDNNPLSEEDQKAHQILPKLTEDFSPR